MTNLRRLTDGTDHIGLLQHPDPPHRIIGAVLPLYRIVGADNASPDQWAAVTIQQVGSDRLVLEHNLVAWTNTQIAAEAEDSGEPLSP